MTDVPPTHLEVPTMLFLLTLTSALARIDVPEVEPDEAMICVARTYNYIGSMVRWTITRDDAFMLRLRNRAAHCRKVEPGTHELGALVQGRTMLPGGPNGGPTLGAILHLDQTQRVEARPGTVTVYRVRIAQYGAPRFIWDRKSVRWLENRPALRWPQVEDFDTPRIRIPPENRARPKVGTTRLDETGASVRERAILENRGPT